MVKYNSSLLVILLFALATTTLFGQNIVFRPFSKELIESRELHETEISLRVRVSARSSSAAILFGALTAPFGAIRSVLLITDDGGKNWREAMPPQDSYEVVGLSWATDKDVFAAVDFAVEGPGWEIQLFASRDGGQNWTERTALKKPYYWCLLDQIAFKGNLGIVSMSCDKEIAEPNEHERTYVTLDGGRSWRQTVFKVSSTKASSSASRSNDGTLWWLEDKGEHYSLHRIDKQGKTVKLNIPIIYGLQESILTAQ